MVGEFNLDQFNKELDQATKGLTEDDLLTLQRSISLDLLARVVEKTPVDTGRARGAWVVGISRPSTGLGRSNKRGFGPVVAGAAKIRSAKPFGVIFISNNVEYIEFLENGSSAQAPAGMLAVSLEETRQTFP